jgi:TRAP-type C4-dicarboxylate transport system substrate-binding protein
MKKILLMTLVAVLAISLLVTGCPPPPPPPPNDVVPPPPVGERIVLDFATFWPAVDFQVTLGHKAWADILEERVEAETPHTLDFFFHYGISPPALRTGVQVGTYDVITSSPGYYPGVFPLWEGAEHPGPLYRENALTMSMAAQRLWDEFKPLRDEVARIEPKVKTMHYWSTGPGWFMMTMGNNVTRLEDFAGKEIRAASAVGAKVIEALGGIPRVMPMGAALEAFEAGIVEGILAPPDVNRGFGLAAFVRSITFAPFSYQIVFSKWMHRPTWDALPPEVQTIFNEVNAAFPEFYGKLRTWGEHEGRMYGRLVHTWNVTWFEYVLPVADPAEYARWMDATDHVIIDWIGGDVTRAHLWGNYTKWDEFYAKTPPWGNFTIPWPAPPSPPTFP